MIPNLPKLILYIYIRYNSKATWLLFNEHALRVFQNTVLNNMFVNGRIKEG